MALLILDLPKDQGDHSTMIGTNECYEVVITLLTMTDKFWLIISTASLWIKMERQV